MILRTSLALIALACPAGAETTLLSMEFPGEKFTLSPDSEMLAEGLLNWDGHDAISVILGPSEAENFLSFTTRHVGEEAIIRICGEEVSRPVLLTPIPGGTILIVGDTTWDRNRSLNFLTARACDPAPSS